MDVILSYGVVMCVGAYCGYRHAFLVLPFLFIGLMLGLMAVFARREEQ